MSNPLVSVVLSVYNGEAFLKDTLDSIFEQSFDDFELIVIDDCSSDFTLNILKSYSDNCLKIIKNSANLGLTICLNIGISCAKGKYIARIDADDLWLRDKLQLQVAALEKSNANVAFCRSYIVYDNGTDTIEWREGTWAHLLWWGLFDNRFGVHSSLVFRKDPIVAMRGYAEPFLKAQDYELYDRLVSRGERFLYVPVPLVIRRHWQGCLSSTNLAEQQAFAEKVSFRAIERLTPDKVDSETLQALRWLFYNGYQPDAESLEKALKQLPAFVINFIERFIDSGKDSQWVWREVAKRIAVRFHELSKLDVPLKPIFTILCSSIINSKSLECTIRSFWYLMKNMNMS